MKLSVILTTLLSTFATSVPDLCDQVLLDATGDPVTDSVGQTLARYCEWTGPDAPLWKADVCCTIDDDGAACSKTDPRGTCPADTTRWYCEYGAADALGGVTCYQPLPSGCEAGMCVPEPEFLPPMVVAEFAMCCSPGGVCQHVTLDNVFDCQGSLLSCYHGYVDTDGYVECWD